MDMWVSYKATDPPLRALTPNHNHNPNPNPNPDPNPNPHQVSYKQLLRLFEPYAPSEVRQLGPGNLKQVCCLTLVVA